MYLFIIYSVVVWGGKDDLIDSEVPEYKWQHAGQGLLGFQAVKLEGSLSSDFFFKV